MNEVITIGLDLAKSVFQVHGVDASGKPVVRRQLRRSQVLSFFKKLSPCLVGMEACATSHYWAREVAALGHEVRMMPARYVKPYVKRNKNDAADAEAICEAVVRASEVSRRLAEIPGVGPLIATALVAAVPDPYAFRSGRDLSAWIGLTALPQFSGRFQKIRLTALRSRPGPGLRRLGKANTGCVRCTLNMSKPRSLCHQHRLTRVASLTGRRLSSSQAALKNRPSPRPCVKD